MHYYRMVYKVRNDNYDEQTMRDHAKDIHDFYMLMRDEYPTRFHDLFEYGFNLKPCERDNGIWMFSNIYWGDRDPGRVDHLHVTENRIRIVLNVEYVELHLETAHQWIE